MGTATEYTLRQILTEVASFMAGVYALRNEQYVVLALSGDLTNEQLHSALTGADLHSPKTHTHVEADVTDLDHDAVKLQGRTLVATAPANGQAMVWDAGNSQWEPGSISGAGFYNAYVCVRDKKAQNTAGGTFTAGALRTRDINDEQADAAGIASIASNQITLAAGTYRCLISCPAVFVDGHQALLYNVTDSAVLLVGTSEYSRQSPYGSSRSFIVGRFTLDGAKTLEVRHECHTTQATNGFGNQTNRTDEIYTVAEFWREV